MIGITAAQRAKQAERGLRNKKGKGACRLCLMPPIKDSEFYYHDLIGQIASC